MRFTRGLKDGLPIALGYVPVAFAYAIRAVDQGFPLWFPILVSGTNFTGTGQFAGTNLIAEGAGFAVLFATMLVINIRYALMSVSIAQKLDGHFPLWKRLIVSFGVTDENYAVAVRQPRKLDFPYLMGLMSCSFAGWLGGTALGAGLSALLASLLTGSAAAWYDILMSAFNISLYAMFVAIIIPPARDDRRVLLLVTLSVAGSCLFYFVPALHSLPSGVDIIVVAIACTTVLSLLFPHAEEENEEQNAAAGSSDENGIPLENHDADGNGNALDKTDEICNPLDKTDGNGNSTDSRKASADEICNPLDKTDENGNSTDSRKASADGKTDDAPCGNGKGGAE